MYKSVLQKFDLRVLVFTPVLSVHKMIQPGRKNSEARKTSPNIYYSVCNNAVLFKSKYTAGIHTFIKHPTPACKRFGGFQYYFFKNTTWKDWKKEEVYQRKKNQLMEKKTASKAIINNAKLIWSYVPSTNKSRDTCLWLKCIATHFRVVCKLSY